MIVIKIYVYLDESGNIHQNSPTPLFAIGGYFVIDEAHHKDKIIQRYKKINKKQKKKRQLPLDQELKSRMMHDDEKIALLSRIQKIDGFYGCAILFDKSHMMKKIDRCNIFFNYGVKLLFHDCILPLLPPHQSYEFILSIDNRNVSVGDLKDLEKFLNTEFCYCDYSFQITYYDSRYHYGIQLADLIVNTFYLRSKNYPLIYPVLKILDPTRFRLNIFPGHIRKGRTKKINFIDKPWWQWYHCIKVRPRTGS